MAVTSQGPRTFQTGQNCLVHYGPNTELEMWVNRIWQFRMHFNAKDRVGLARRRQTEAQNDQVLEAFKAAVALSVGEGKRRRRRAGWAAWATVLWRLSGFVRLAVPPSPERPVTDCHDDICASACAHQNRRTNWSTEAIIHNTATGREVKTYTKRIYKRRIRKQPVEVYTDYIVHSLYQANMTH